MLKLPVCPHCGAVYSYKEVSGMKSGTNICYHCEKKFRVDKIRGRAVLLSVVCITLIIINTAIMVSSENFVPAVIMIANIIAVSAAFLMFPLTVKFIPEKLTKAEKRERRK